MSAGLSAALPGLAMLAAVTIGLWLRGRRLTARNKRTQKLRDEWRARARKAEQLAAGLARELRSSQARELAAVAAAAERDRALAVLFGRIEQLQAQGRRAQAEATAAVSVAISRVIELSEALARALDHPAEDRTDLAIRELLDRAVNS